MKLPSTGAVSRVVAIAVALFLLGHFPLAEAQMGNAQLRGSTRIINRATQDQTRQSLSPQLKVRRNATGAVNAITTDASGSFLAMAPSDGTIRIWGIRQSIAFQPATVMGPAVKNVLLGPVGRYAVTLDSGGTVALGSPLDGVPFSQVGVGRPPAVAIALASASGRLSIARQSGPLEVWDVESKQPQYIPLPAEAALTGIRDAEGGQRWVVALIDGRVLTGTVGTASDIHQIDLGTRPTSLDVANSGIIVIGTENGSVHLWNGSTTAPQAYWNAHSGPVSAVAVVGERIVSAHRTEGVIVWSREGRLERSLKVTGVTSLGHEDVSGRLLIASDEGMARILDLTSGHETAKLIATRDGWIGLDEAGRFDGASSSAENVVWEVGNTELALNRFARRYFEPGLLSRSFAVGALLTPAAKPIGDGIQLPPTVRIDVPAQPSHPEAPVDIRVSAVAAPGSSATVPRLYLNGKRVDPSRIVDQDTRAVGNLATSSATFRVVLSGGENRLTAIASTLDEVESEPVNAVVNFVPDNQPTKMHLLTVGINKYAGSQWALNYAAADARAVATLFGNIARRRFASIQQTQLLDEGATRNAILLGLEKLAQVGRQDVVVLFLSGHARAIGDEWYFMPRDMRDLTNDDQVKAVGISGRRIRDALLASPAHQILLIVDACQSGATLSEFAGFQQRRRLSDLSRDTGIHILAASRADQQAPEFPILGGGIFTYTLLQSFVPDGSRLARADQAPEDRRLTVTEVKNFVERNVPLLALELERRAAKSSGQRGSLMNDVPVTPTGLTLGSDFVLLGGAE